ncbi:DUF6265 family protein [Taibaiella koreensis]|uniref:DUF6265 family protein n=1 Tax=Taibaiella koreensis TaxID=1268548 RepID=UPI0013C33C82|nr:DUF6265 family protein [Taibaiella koreensis]
MKRQLTLCSGIAALLLCSSWLPGKPDPMAKVSWLTGTWESKTSRGSLFEEWLRLNDSTLAGRSYVLHGKDTMVLETIRLCREDREWYYIPVVKDQNEGKPVKFRMINTEGEALVFENPEHDFPQVITYRKTGKDALIAEISGKAKGNARKETFPMKRIAGN